MTPLVTRPPLPSAWRDRYVSAMRARCMGKCEVTANRGPEPDYLQLRNGGTLGDYWCMHLVGATGRDTFGKTWPLLLSGSCQQQRDRAKAKGALRTRAEFDATRKANPLLVAGWVFLVIDTTVAGGHAHHTGSVGDVDDETGAIVVTGPRGGFLTCEGNAADPKATASRNGDGAYHGRERGTPDDHTTYEFIDLGAL